MNIALGQLDFIDDTLKSIVWDAQEFTGFEFTITSIYRIGDSGVHGQLPTRGIDVRCRDAVIGHLIADFINGKWKYDPSRPEKKCCIFHNVGQGNHLHFQVHPNTKHG